MSMHFSDLANQAATDGMISAEELLSLRRDAWANGGIEDSEADAIFAANDHLKHSSPEWVDFFVEAISEYLVSGASPRGYISENQALWLIAHIDRDKRLDSLAELELLEKLFEKAVSIPALLQNYAIKQIEAAVMQGDGPTRDGTTLDQSCITTTECKLLRRFVFAPGGDRPAAVGASEAEMLFRIKNATLGAANAPEWKQLFVQGVGNYLQGFGGHEPLSLDRATELERFMNDTAVNIGGFFGRMAHSSPSGVWKQTDKPYLDVADEAAEAAHVTRDEQTWLKNHNDADGQLDALEQALLDFLAEEG